MSRKIKVEKHPEIVERELGTREYWFEEYRRVIVAPASTREDCLFVSIDLYSKSPPSIAFSNATDSILLEEDGVKLLLYPLIVGGNESNYVADLELAGLRPRSAWLVLLKTVAGVEVIGFQAVYCGSSKKPAKSDLWKLYRSLVLAVEKRDPKEKPLAPPQTPLRLVTSRIGLSRDIGEDH